MNPFQVSNIAKSHRQAHLATILVLQPLQGDARAAEDGARPGATVRMTPFLAHNLGLEYHAAPFFRRQRQLSQHEHPSTQQSHAPAESFSCGRVSLSRWRGSSSGASHATEIPVAEAVWVSSVRQPDVGFLTAQFITEEEAPAVAHESSGLAPDTAGAAAHQQKKRSNRQADDSFDTALIAALWSHFQQQPRYARQLLQTLTVASHKLCSWSVQRSHLQAADMGCHAGCSHRAMYLLSASVTQAEQRISSEVS